METKEKQGPKALNADEREKLYEKFYTPDEPKVEEKADGKKEHPPKPNASDKGSSSVSSSVNDASDAPSGKGEKGQDGSKDSKPQLSDTVPHAALHETREKLKQAKLDRDNLQQRLEESELEKSKLMEEAQSFKETEDQEISDYDAEIKRLNRRLSEQDKFISELRSKEKTRTQTEIENVRKTNMERTNAQVDELDARLVKEGFKGFKKFRLLVTQEILKQVQDNGVSDPKEIAEKYDNPHNWEMVFKEKIFPDISSLLEEVGEEKRLKEKEEAKLKAGLVSESGSPTPLLKGEGDSEDISPESYFKMRRDQSVTG